MRRTTALMSQWRAEPKSGEALYFEACKGGYFSENQEHGLKVMGKMGTGSQCVKSGTEIISTGKNIYGVENYSHKDTAYDGTEYNLSNNEGLCSTKVTVKYRGNNSFAWGLTTAQLSITNYINNVSFPEDAIYLEPGTYTVSVEYISGTFPDEADLYVKQAISRIVYRMNTETNWGGDGYGFYKICDLDENTPFGTTFSRTFTINEKKPFAIFQELSTTNAEGVTADYDFSFKVQLEKSVAATAYEPFLKSSVTVPCDLYEGDVWYPMSGEVINHNGEAEVYEPQPIFAMPGTVNVTQRAVDLSAELSATMLVRRD